MPIIITFDLPGDTDANDRARIRVAFQRLRWEFVGGTAYRYPRIGDDHPSEDWFNHVAPALMYLRSLTQRQGINVSRFSIDACSSGGHSGGIGAPIHAPADITMYEPSSAPDVLSEQRLKGWIESCATNT